MSKCNFECFYIDDNGLCDGQKCDGDSCENFQDCDACIMLDICEKMEE